MLRFLDSLALARLLRQGSRRFNLEMVVLVGLAGLSNAAVLAIINNAAANATNATENGRMLVLFLVTIVLYVVSQRFILFATTGEVEKLLGDIRVRIADSIRRTDMQALDYMGREEIFGVISRETQNISQGATAIALAVQSATMVVFAVGYLAILSKTAFVITVGISALAIVHHMARVKVLNQMLGDAQRRENEFLALLNHLISGFKEVRLRRARSDDLYREMRVVSDSVQSVKVRTSNEFSSHYIFSQVMFYGLLAAIVFLLPRIGTEYSQVVMKLTAAVLFIIGPLSAVVGTVPVFSSANVSAQNVFDLEERLAAVASPERNGAADASAATTLKRIELKHVVFQYPDRGTGSVFRLGPIDLQVNAGEILFLAGGNGSGKSTLLKVLTGLYHPQSGAILADGTLVTQENAGWYRSHFAAVFSDYHLFDKLYGLSQVPPERVRELLQMLRIADKTSFENGRFTTLDLSQGQRKRLGLLVALLEKRPILVLDEWAADQDPGFRKFFYEEMLPELRKEGHTIVAATHDDRYFDCADRVVELEYGEFIATGKAPARKGR